MTGMTKDYAIAILRRMQDPDPFEPRINEAAFDALEMAIQAIQRYATWSQTYSNMVENVVEEVLSAKQTGKSTQNVPNDDLVSRKSAIEALHTWFADGFEEDRWWNSTHVLAAIEGVPSAQPERKKGKWIWHTSDIWECSECGRRTHVDECMEKPMYEWCPYCGAEMKGEQE